MGATYTRQSSAGIVDGGVIEATDLNGEFDQLLAAFAVSSGHTHDGTAAEGGPITKLLGTAITIGDATAGTDIAVTFDGETNDGVLTWMEDEDLFKFSDAINVGVDDTGYDVKFFGDTASRYWLWDTSADGVVQRGTLTVGVDDAGHDVKFFGDTASAYMLWDTSTDDLVLAGAAGIDLAGDIDVDGTANLDVVDIDGAVQLDATLTVGADDQGYDVKFFGDTASAYMLWDTSTDDLVLAGAAGIDLAGDIDVDGTANLDAVDIDGAVQIDGATTIGVDGTGLDVKFFGDTAGSFLLWDQSDDALELTDSSPIKIGDGGDMQVYHDGTNSYITNSQGALKIATESSGIAVTIGHSTSEVTIADNLTVTGTLTLGSNAELTEAELELLDGLTAGTAIASKVVTTDSSIDTTGQRNLTISGELDAATGDFSGDVDVDGTLEADAITINSTAIGSIYGVVAGSSSIVTTGALDSGSITSGFGTIDTGSSTITTTGLISGGSLDIDDVLINGTTIGHTNDTDLMTVADGVLTVAGELDAATLDISGNADIDGTTNLDAVDIDGAVQIDGTVTVGVDDTGLDVKFFGASAGAYMEWDESADQLRIMGASADATTSTGKLLLATSLTDINANDVIGKIEFQAPHEAGGTDAITVAASIQALAQATFSSSVNATDLIFYTGHSETATEKFRFTSQGELGVGGTNYGTDGQVLTSTGAGTAPAWEDASSGAVSAINNATANELVTIGSTTTELDAEANLTFDGSTLALTGSQTTTGTINGVGIKYNITDFVGSLLISNDAGTGTLDAASANTGIGHEVFDDLTTGDDNTGLGYQALTVLTTGSSNTAVGSAALDANTTGDSNTAVGRCALSANTSGANNIGIGFGAAKTTTTGIANVAVGGNALKLNETGCYNIAIGKDTMEANTTGCYNVAVGYLALDANTTAHNNTAVGDASLSANTTGYINVAIGKSAMAANTTGQGNVAIGGNALDANTTGAANVAIGCSAMSANTTCGYNVGIGFCALTTQVDGGVNNTAVGSCSLKLNSTGDLNVGLGYAAMEANTTAGANVAVGAYASRCNTEGGDNVSMGYAALYTNTTGGKNTAIGCVALCSNTTASNNSAFGVQALKTNTTGTTNTAVGSCALDANQTADSNTAVGSSALSSNTTGSSNTSIGAFSMNDSTTGSNNLAVGRGALDANTTGAENTALGMNALSANITTSCNTAIGKGAMLVAVNGDNTAVGVNALVASNSGYTNTAVGQRAGCTTTSGYANTYIGRTAIGSAADNNDEVVVGAGLTGKGDQTAFIGGSSGAYNAENNAAWTTTSDRRIKKNIVDNNIGLEKINKIKVRNFEYKTKDEITELSADSVINKKGIQLGVIAQEIEEILPEVVKVQSTGVKAVNPDNITWYLVNAIKELKKEIEELKKK